MATSHEFCNSDHVAQKALIHVLDPNNIRKSAMMMMILVACAMRMMVAAAISDKRHQLSTVTGNDKRKSKAE